MPNMRYIVRLCDLREPKDREVANFDTPEKALAEERRLNALVMAGPRPTDGLPRPLYYALGITLSDTGRSRRESRLFNTEETEHPLPRSA